jgi:tetratricopeptide (TPR) repeat protein
MQNNKIVKKGISAIPEILTTRYRQGFWERKENLYRPLSLVMFAIEWQIAPEKPFLGHLMNVLLYVITGILLFNTLVKLLPQKNFIIPFITTMIFIAHPLHTEVVANIKSRDEILTFLFVTLSLNALISYIRSSKILSLAISLLCFFLALLAKENAITFVVIVPLALYFFTDAKSKKIIFTSAVYLGIAAIYLLLRAAILKGLTGEAELQLVNNSLLGTPDLITRFASAMYIMGRYLLLLIIPHPLVFDYSYNQIPNVPITDFRALISIVVYLSFFIYVIKNLRGKNLKAFGILFFLVTISLVSNIFFLIESTMAERFLYMPSLGFCFAIAVLLAEIFKTDTHKKIIFKKNTSFIASTITILILFSIKTFSRNFDWKDNLTLLSHDVKTSPESARIRYAYGSAILIEQALKENDESKKMNLLDKSIEQLEKGVSILNTYSDAFYHLALAYKEKSDYANAIKNFESARRGRTFTEPEFYISSGVAYGGMHQYEKAITDLTKATEISPKSYDAYNNLGLYYLEMGKAVEAIKSLNKAIEIKPDFDKAFYNLGNTYAKIGDYRKAIEQYKKSVAISPLYEDAYNNMGNSYAAMKDYSNAITYYKKVVEINPQNYQVLNNIGVTYHILGDTVNGNHYLQMAQTARSK